jgi:alpha-galactosidase
VLTPIMKEVLFNAELVSVNQQPATRQGMGLVRIATGPCGGGAPAPPLPCETWARPPGDDGAHYVLLFNPNDPTNAADPASGPNATLTVSWAALGLPAGSSAAVRDLWAHADLGSFTGGYTGAAILPHEARTLKVTPA